MTPPHDAVPLPAANPPAEHHEAIEPTEPRDIPQRVPTRRTLARRGKETLWERSERFISRLSTRNNFWHRLCALIWLPFAFHSGIRMKRIDAKTFAAVLPFKRFNRNWYNAMAGAALLGNAEVAGGMYVFGVVGADYTVVCKHLEYKFLRPCFGPVIYKMTPREEIAPLVKTGDEFNLTLDLDVRQQSWKKKVGYRELRVGACVVTFHITPKVHHKEKKLRRQLA